MDSDQETKRVRFKTQSSVLAWSRLCPLGKIQKMSETELKVVSAKMKKQTARVEALERLLQRIIQQKPVSERQ
jgi:hypothetical protein